jgi:hypothetical protein
MSILSLYGEDKHLDQIVATNINTNERTVLISAKFNHKLNYNTHDAIMNALALKDKKGNNKYGNKKICRDLIHTLALTDDEIGLHNAYSFIKKYPVVDTAFKGVNLSLF